MADNYLIVVDMQNDFVTGSLGTPEARAIVGRVVKKVQDFNGIVIFTMDTHYDNYLSSSEGKKLPVPHCIVNSDGWQLIPDLDRMQMENSWDVYEKNTFGSVDLAHDLLERSQSDPIGSIELIGLCTDICVVSNALLLKAHLPEVPILVDASCCAGVTPEKHQAALETMRSCQIEILP